MTEGQIEGCGSSEVGSAASGKKGGGSRLKKTSRPRDSIHQAQGKWRRAHGATAWWARQAVGKGRTISSKVQSI